MLFRSMEQFAGVLGSITLASTPTFAEKSGEGTKLLLAGPFGSNVLLGCQGTMGLVRSISEVSRNRTEPIWLRARSSALELTPHSWVRRGLNPRFIA